MLALASCATSSPALQTVEKDADAILRDVGVRGTVQDAPGLSDAVATVWKSYGRTDPPPQVALVTGADLSCTDPNGNPGFPVVLLSGPACREGYTLLPWKVSVAYRGQPWSQGPLAHELEHVAMIRSLQGNPIGDPNHATAGFQIGGAVDQGNAALAAKGL